MSGLTMDAQRLFDRYLDCWNKRDLEGVAACFDEPAMFILPTGAVSLPDRAAVVSLLKTVFAGLEAAGFSHTTIGAISATSCGEGMAVLDATDVTRLKQDGSVLETIDGHYVLRKCDDAWRLTVAVSCANGWRSA